MMPDDSVLEAEERAEHAPDGPPEAMGRPPRRCQTRELLTTAALALEMPALVEEAAGSILAREQKSVFAGRAAVIAVAAALYAASSDLGCPRPVADLLAWHPGLAGRRGELARCIRLLRIRRVSRPSDYVGILSSRVGLDGREGRKARAFAARHDGSARSPVVVAAAALAAAGVPTREAARAAGLSEAGVIKCLAALEGRRTARGAGDGPGTTAGEA